MTKYIMAISFTICKVFINIHFLLRSRFKRVILLIFFFHPVVHCWKVEQATRTWTTTLFSEFTTNQGYYDYLGILSKTQVKIKWTLFMDKNFTKKITNLNIKCTQPLTLLKHFKKILFFSHGTSNLQKTIYFFSDCSKFIVAVKYLGLKEICTN